VGTGTLTEKQAAFIAAYQANGGNATDAARQAGYSNPESEGWRLMQTPAVRAAVDALDWLTVAQDRAFCRDRARKLADDTGQPGDTRGKMLDRLDAWATAREERMAKRRAAEGELAPVRIADGASGVPDGAPGFDPDGFLAQVLAATKTTTPQHTDNAT
jgi:hypothetical protein